MPSAGDLSLSSWTWVTTQGIGPQRASRRSGCTDTFYPDSHMYFWEAARGELRTLLRIQTDWG